MGARVWLVAVAAAMVSAGWFLAGEPTQLSELPLDDGWIHLVYVRGLLRDGLPTYNPGIPEAGFSSPLWLAVLVPFHSLAGLVAVSPVVPAKLASLLLAIVAAVGLARLARALRPAASGVALLAAAALPFFSPAVTFSAVSGMEVTLAAACVVHALAAAVERRRSRAALLLALAVWARPEAMVVVAVVAAHVLGTAGPRAALRVVVPAVLAAAAWATFNLLVTGHALPNTFYVKATTGDLGGKLRYLVEYVIFGGGVAYGALMLALGAWGLAVASRRRGRADALLVAAAVVAPVGAVVVGHMLVPRVLFYDQRYFHPFTFAGLVFVVVALDDLAARLAARPIFRPLPALAVVAASLPALAAARASYAGHCRDTRHLHVEPARDVARFIDASEAVAVEGAGAIRYLADRTTLDLLGLNDHQLAHARGDDRARICRVVAVRPALVIVPEEWLAGLAPALDLEPLVRYEVPRWSVVGGVVPRVVVTARARVNRRAIELCAR